jgi:hypothetical protein
MTNPKHTAWDAMVEAENEMQQDPTHSAWDAMVEAGGRWPSRHRSPLERYLGTQEDSSVRGARGPDRAGRVRSGVFGEPLPRWAIRRCR